MNKRRFWICVILVVVLVCVFTPQAAADISGYSVARESYELNDDGGFDIAKTKERSYEVGQP